MYSLRIILKPPTLQLLVWTFKVSDARIKTIFMFLVLFMVRSAFLNIIVNVNEHVQYCDLSIADNIAEDVQYVPVN